MDNTLQIVNGNVTLNGTAVRCVRGFQLQTLESAPALAEVSITFDVPVKSLTTISNSESVDQSPISKPETTKKNLYREFLGKQLGILEAAQEEARSEGNFNYVLVCSQKILELSKEIEELNADETVGESVDQPPIHQPETKLDLMKLVQFAIVGVNYLICVPDSSDKKELTAYKKELERERERLFRNG